MPPLRYNNIPSWVVSNHKKRKTFSSEVLSLFWKKIALTFTITESKMTKIDSKNNNAIVEHEASTSKINEEQLYYCRQRGISHEDAVSLIVNGFCKQVLQELPMEFAVEAQKLVAISLEGSVG